MDSKNPTLEDFLLPYQKSLADAKQKKKLALFGRQLGKSFAMAYIAVKAVLTSSKPNPLALCISTGARASSEFLKKVAQMAEAVHIIDPSVTYACSMDKVQFSNGARVISLPSGNPAGLRGYSAACIVIDEAGYIENPEEVWAAIAPTLTRDPDAELILASTPAGKASWFYKLYEDAIQDNSWYVQTTTIEDAVKQGLQVDLEQLKSTIKDPDVWDREYMCQFAQEYSSLVDISILDFIDPPSSADLDTSPHFLGMDIGSTSDKTAIADIVELPDHTLLVSDIVLLHKASYEHQLQILKEKHEKMHYKAGYIDQNGIGSALAEFATKQVSTLIKGYTWTGSNKTPAYENLRAKIFDHKLKFASHLKPLITQDFQNVHRVVNEAGNVKYEAGRDSNGHSDSTSAIVLGLEAAREHPTQMQMPKADAIRSVFGPMPFGGSRLFR